MSNCRSCNAEIEFAATGSGKQMPMDVAETPCKTCGGSGRIKSPVGESEFDCGKCSGTGALRLSHFSSCPNAAQHRKPR